MKNNNILVVALVALLVITLGLGGYIVYDKSVDDNAENINSTYEPVFDNANIEDSKNIEINVNTTNTQEDKPEEKQIFFYDVKDLNVKYFPEYSVFADISKTTNVVEDVLISYDHNYRAVLDLSGEVTVYKYPSSEEETEISSKLNISGVIDIVQFSVPSMETEQLLYLLTDNGYLYCYRIGNIDEYNFDVAKVENVSNVKKIFISNYYKLNAGGSWALFAITDKNDCIMINAESV